jgi:hypothetical protein
MMFRQHCSVSTVPSALFRQKDDSPEVSDMKDTLAESHQSTRSTLCRPWTWAQNRVRSESGQSLVEFGLILPLLLLLTLGVIDLGLGFKTYISLTNAAREGARWVTVYPDDPAGAKARALGEAERVGLAEGDLGSGGVTVFFTPSKEQYSAGEEVTAHVQYDYDLLFGQITGIPAVSFEAKATMIVLYDE